MQVKCIPFNKKTNVSKANTSSANNTYRKCIVAVFSEEEVAMGLRTYVYIRSHVYIPEFRRRLFQNGTRSRYNPKVSQASCLEYNFPKFVERKYVPEVSHNKEWM